MFLPGSLPPTFAVSFAPCSTLTWATATFWSVEDREQSSIISSPPPSLSPPSPSPSPPLPLPFLPSLPSYLFCQCLLPALVPIQLCHAEYHEGPGYLCVGCVYVCVPLQMHVKNSSLILTHLHLHPPTTYLSSSCRSSASLSLVWTSSAAYCACTCREGWTSPRSGWSASKSSSLAVW